jgi:hypothetical protein
VGEWGGHMLMECDDPVTIHKFVFPVHAVIPSRTRSGVNSK